MSPSQIIKSACPAGYTLKSFANQVSAGTYIYQTSLSYEVENACKDWIAHKVQQRKQAKQCQRSMRRGHDDVHAQQTNRSRQNVKPFSRTFIAQDSQR
jgi:hypothetical protein